MHYSTIYTPFIIFTVTITQPCININFPVYLLQQLSLNLYVNQYTPICINKIYFKTVKTFIIFFRIKVGLDIADHETNTHKPTPVLQKQNNIKTDGQGQI